MSVDNKFKRTLFLTKFNLKKDFLLMLVYILGLGSLLIATVLKYKVLYDGGAKSAHEIQIVLESPSMTALLGYFKYSINTTGRALSAQVPLLMSLVMAVLNINFAGKLKHEEDDNVSEIIMSKSVGKASILLANSIEVFILDLFLGVVFSGLVMLGNFTHDYSSYLLFGMIIAAIGWMFATFTYLFDQITVDAKTTSILSYTVLWIMYVLRIFTDLKHPQLTWFIPLGWSEKASIFVHDNWLPVWLILGLSILMWVVAFFINQNRDTGSGIISINRGRSSASIFLKGPVGLIFKSNRSFILSWMLALFALGSMFGSIFDSIGNLAKNNPLLEQALGKAMVHQHNNKIILNFISMLSVVLMAGSSIIEVKIINQLTGDSDKGYLESIYARSISRTRLLFSYVVTSIVAGFLGMVSAYVGMYWNGNNVLHNNKIALKDYLKIIIASFPVVLVALSIAVLVNILAPKFNILTWIYVTYGFFTVYMGKILKFPGYIQKSTAYGWTNQVPFHNVNYEYIMFLIIFSAGLILIGWWGYLQKDLN